MPWSIVSKAALKSIKTSAQNSPLSTVQMISFMIAVSVECPFRYLFFILNFLSTYKISQPSRNRKSIKKKKIADLDLNLYIGLDIIKPVNVVRDLGVYLDSELSMKHHISTAVRACFFHLRRLKSIRRILGADVTSGLVSAFVTTRMDYCNSIMAALPQSSIDPLQRVQNDSKKFPSVRN